MNNLFATWHRPVDVDLPDELDVVELLSRASWRLADCPGLEKARRLVDAALDEVCAWYADTDPLPSGSRYAATPR